MPLPQPELSTLRRAQKGDARAFASLVTAYETPVFNYILRIVGDRMLAEDLTQDVFLRIYHGLAGFSLRCRFTTWLFQVAKNRVLDELRARERRPHPDALDDVAPLEVVDAPPERIEMIDAVWRAVGGAQSGPQDGAAPARRGRPVLRGDRGLARDHAGDGEVADLQGARRGAGRARTRGHDSASARFSPAEDDRRRSASVLEPLGEALR